ncbi:3'-5' exonuclease [Allorhizobium undicola]|uniref:3'-5' exonuclease n=1 Tax=Allorhizobium undicola TaxID=78527 RepID=UPI003D34452C
MGARKRFPKKIAVVDVETTGLRLNDRVVSFAMLEVSGESLVAGQPDIRGTHLIFNPQKRSQTRAREVHGYSEQELKVQEPFSLYAAEIRNALNAADLIVAHNCAFDMRFLQYEMQLAGVGAINTRTHCTMIEYRKKYGSPANLDHVNCAMGLPLRATTHSAFEDAQRCFLTYLWLNGVDVTAASVADQAPQNFVRTDSPAAPQSEPAVIPVLRRADYKEEVDRVEYHYISKPVPPLRPPSIIDRLFAVLFRQS